MKEQETLTNFLKHSVVYMLPFIKIIPTILMRQQLFKTDFGTCENPIKPILEVHFYLVKKNK